MIFDVVLRGKLNGGGMRGMAMQGVGGGDSDGNERGGGDSDGRVNSNARNFAIQLFIL